VKTQDFWPNRSILSSHNLTSSHRPLNIDLHPSVTQANPRRSIDVQKSRSPKARPKAWFFVPVWARPDTTSFGPELARHDSSSRAQAATSARRAAWHDLYRPARPLTPPRSNLILSLYVSQSRPPIPPRDGNGAGCDNPPRKIPYYRLNQSTVVIKR
jgi:hypothetical protein